jgi:hypothetical protein
MTSTRQSARSSATGRWLGFGLGAISALLPVVANAAIADVFYERAVMTAADQRCRLFTPEVSSALAAGRAQAHSAAIRSGVDPDILDKVDGQARAKAYGVACNSPDIATAAGRIRAAFEPYSHQMLQVYSGDFAGWTAQRSIATKTPVWTLSQPAVIGKDRVTFGWAAVNNKSALLAIVAFADQGQPYAARLVLRDPGRSKRAYLDARQTDAKGRLPLTARVTPRSSTRAFLAEAKDVADPRLAPGASKTAIAFRFPAAAAAAMADLDPREAVELEFVFSGPGGGEIVRRALIEVGDFAAGQAFLSLAQR